MNMLEASKWKRLRTPKNGVTGRRAMAYVRTAVGMMPLLLAAGGVLASEDTIPKGDFGVVNVADNTNHGFTR